MGGGTGGGGAFPGGSPGGGGQVDTDKLGSGYSVAVVDRGGCSGRVGEGGGE